MMVWTIQGLTAVRWHTLPHANTWAVWGAVPMKSQAGPHLLGCCGRDKVPVLHTITGVLVDRAFILWRLIALRLRSVRRSCILPRLLLLLGTWLLILPSILLPCLVLQVGFVRHLHAVAGCEIHLTGTGIQG